MPSGAFFSAPVTAFCFLFWIFFGFCYLESALSGKIGSGV